MQQFMLGVLVTLTPSVLFVAWTLWRVNGRIDWQRQR